MDLLISRLPENQTTSRNVCSTGGQSSRHREDDFQWLAYEFDTCMISASQSCCLLGCRTVAETLGVIGDIVL